MDSKRIPTSIYPDLLLPSFNIDLQDINELLTEVTLVHLAKNPNVAKHVNEEFEKYRTEIYQEIKEERMFYKEYIDSMLLVHRSDIKKAEYLYLHKLKKDQNEVDSWILSLIKRASKKLYDFAYSHKSPNLVRLMNFINKNYDISIINLTSENGFEYPLYYYYLFTFKCRGLTSIEIPMEDAEIGYKIKKVIIAGLSNAVILKKAATDTSTYNRSDIVAAEKLYKELTGNSLKKQQLFKDFLEGSPNVPQKYVGSYMAMRHVLQIFEFNFFELFSRMSFTNEDFYKLYIKSKNHISVTNATFSNLSVHIVEGLFLLSLIKEINEFRNKPELDQLSIEMKYSNEILKQMEENQNQNEKLKSLKEEMAQLKEMNNRLLLELNSLKKEQKQQIVLDEERDKNKKELQILRETLFSGEEIIPELDQIDLEEKIDHIKSFKLTLIGGHPNFHKNIKRILPSIKIVGAEQLSISLDFIKKMDALIFVTSYNSHSLYKKIQKYWDSDNTRLLFINTQRNTEEFIYLVYDKLIKN